MFKRTGDQKDIILMPLNDFKYEDFLSIPSRFLEIESQHFFQFRYL